MRKSPALVIISICVLSSALIYAYLYRGSARSSTDYEVPVDLLDAGGEAASSTDYAVQHSIGQRITGGIASSANYKNWVGGIAQIKKIQKPTATPLPTATPFPNYVELSVQANTAGGDDFWAGDSLMLEWRVYPDDYGFNNVLLYAYLAAAYKPADEDTVVTVETALSTGTVFLFDKTLTPSLYDPLDHPPTYRDIAFPLPQGITNGTFTFLVPQTMVGRWAFMAAFIRKDNGQYPADPPVEISNGFDIH